MRTTSFQEIIHALECEVYTTGSRFEEVSIRNVVASDLMSDVLSTESVDFILATSLESEQVMHTADIVGAFGVLLVNGKKPRPSAIALAEAKDLTLLSTPRRLFECCVGLGQLRSTAKAAI